MYTTKPAGNLFDHLSDNLLSGTWLSGTLPRRHHHAIRYKRNHWHGAVRRMVLLQYTTTMLPAVRAPEYVFY